MHKKAFAQQHKEIFRHQTSLMEVAARQIEGILRESRKIVCQQHANCDEKEHVLELPEELGKQILCKLVNMGLRSGFMSRSTQTPPGGAQNAIHAFDVHGVAPHAIHYVISCKKCGKHMEGPDESLVQHAISHANRKRYACSRCGMEENERGLVANHRPICPFRGKKAKIHDRISDDVVRKSWWTVFAECFTEVREENFNNGLFALNS